MSRPPSSWPMLGPKVLAQDSRAAIALTERPIKVIRLLRDVALDVVDHSPCLAGPAARRLPTVAYLSSQAAISRPP
jgi:hypothetical protein